MIKKKPLPKRAVASEKAKNVTNKSKAKKAKIPVKSAAKRTSKVAAASAAAAASSDDDSDASSSSAVQKRGKGAKKKPLPFLAADLVVRKRMASLNASAMLAASYEVERHFDQCDSMYNSSSAAAESDSDPSTSPKKIKTIKNEVDESKEVNFGFCFFLFCLILMNVFLKDSTRIDKCSYCQGHRRNHNWCIRKFSIGFQSGSLL